VGRTRLICNRARSPLAQAVGIVPAFAQCDVPYQLTNGQVADATQVMGDVNALVDCIEDAVPAGSQNAIQVNGGNGGFLAVGALANGQLLIGSSGNPPQAANLTAGPGITITNTAGGITLSSAGAPGGGPGSIQFNSAGSFGGLQLTDGMIVIGSGATFSATAKSSNVLLTDSNTPVGGAVRGVTAIVSNPQSIPFSLQAIVPDLVPGTPYWFDIGLAAIGGGTASVENISITAGEM
jgi:hypothetical protein